MRPECAALTRRVKRVLRETLKWAVNFQNSWRGGNGLKKRGDPRRPGGRMPGHSHVWRGSPTNKKEVRLNVAPLTVVWGRATPAR